MIDNTIFYLDEECPMFKNWDVKHSKKSSEFWHLIVICMVFIFSCVMLMILMLFVKENKRLKIDKNLKTVLLMEN